MHSRHPAPRRSTLSLLTTAVLGGGLLVASLTGCNGKRDKDFNEEAKQAATDRWHALRSQVHLDMAEQQFEAGQLEKAEATVREALSVDEDNPGLFELAGRIKLEQGELEYAFKLFTQAIVYQDLPDAVPDADPYYYQGIILQRWQRGEEALERYQAARRLEPSNPTRLLAVAEMLVELDRMDEAVEKLEAKLDYFAETPSLRVALGHIYNLQGDPDRAADAYADALLLDEENTLIRESMAKALLKAERLEQGIVELRLLLEMPGYAQRTDLMRTLAGAELRAGRVAEAKQVYVEVTRIDGDNTNDWIKLGELAWRLEDVGGTLIAANRVMELAPSRHEGYLMAGMVWQKRERLVDALRLYDRAAELSADDPRPLLMRGLALQRAGKPAAAERAYQRALERRPGDARAKRLLAGIQNRQANAGS